MELYAAMRDELEDAVGSLWDSGVTVTSVHVESCQLLLYLRGKNGDCEIKIVWFSLFPLGN